MIEDMKKREEEREEAIEARIEARMAARVQEQVVALTAHYQRQLATVSGHFAAQIPGMEPPPASIYAPPPVVPLPGALPLPGLGRVSTLPLALACRVSWPSCPCLAFVPYFLQVLELPHAGEVLPKFCRGVVLITSLGLCAGTVGGFEPDSRC